MCTPGLAKAVNLIPTLKKLFSFAGGFSLGQLYYVFFLKEIHLPDKIGPFLSIFISIILENPAKPLAKRGIYGKYPPMWLSMGEAYGQQWTGCNGIGNTISIQLRCISLLMLPMYCGKAGRGVLKAVVLTYVVAGPITNMGLNAKEIVRIFACSAQLSQNLSEIRYKFMSKPIKTAILRSRAEINEFKDAFRSIDEITTPIKNEIETSKDLEQIIQQSNIVDEFFGNKHRSEEIEKKYQTTTKTKKDLYQNQYLKKAEYRCENQITQGVFKCVEMFDSAYEACCRAAPAYAAATLCYPLTVEFACNIMHFIDSPDICDGKEQIDPGLGEGYYYLKKLKDQLLKNINDVKLQYKVTYEKELYNVQDARETGKRVLHEFEQRGTSMQYVVSVVNICLALFLLRILFAAQSYHDLYLTSIAYDNLYITSYFKQIDQRRKLKNKYTLLPLKKMERNKYIDVHSFEYKSSQRSKLVTPILKVMLEVVTATTFVMLDRLFFEALDVVRKHASSEMTQQGTRDLEIEVEGNGTVATMIHNLLSRLNTTRYLSAVTNKPCLPQPSAMPIIFFVKIYCGYLWILLLLLLNPYTFRLRRLICSYFYPRREKQRILHLYNDVLKKRLKMQKTLRRKALQAVRAHYLSGENLRSLKMRFPRLLGWLTVLPAARMPCLICGETEPRIITTSSWRRCNSAACGFAWCGECWSEAGERCLACDPALTRLSDLDSLSDDQPTAY